MIVFFLFLWFLSPPTHGQESLLDALETEVQGTLVSSLPKHPQQTAEISKIFSGQMKTCKIQLRNNLPPDACRKVLRSIEGLTGRKKLVFRSSLERLMKEKEKSQDLNDYIQKRKAESPVGTIHE